MTSIPNSERELLLDRSFLAPHALRKWAQSRPELIAIQHVDGGSVTYGGLDVEARTWADALGRLGIGTGSHVGSFLPNQFDSFRTLLGVAWQRAVEVPINVAYVGRGLQYLLAHADVRYLLTVKALVPRLVAIMADLPTLEVVVVLDSMESDTLASTFGRAGLHVVGRHEFLEGAEATEDLAGPDCWDMAALLYTSGTTGPSKAVRMPWGAIYQNWGWIPDETIGPGEGLHCALPLFHNAGRSGFNRVLARGGRFVVRERFSASSVWDEIRRTDCKALALVGPLTALLYSAERRIDDADNPLQYVILGPMIPEIEDFERRFGVKVCVAYGQTEIGCPISSGWDHGPVASCGKVTQGYPWPEVRIVDEHDVPLGPCEPGEMVVRAKAPWGLNLGYYKMEAETRDAWRNGWFHTGDVLTYDREGNFYFVDRLKDAIRRRGENISSFEVESYIREYPGVIDCAVVGVPSGLGDEEILAVLVVQEPEVFDLSRLGEVLEERMPRFMVPRYLEILEDLPRAETTGRVRKQVLRERGITPDAWVRNS